jgi:hypothetical protein
MASFLGAVVGSAGAAPSPVTVTVTMSVTMSVTMAFLWKSWCMGEATTKLAERRVMIVAECILNVYLGMLLVKLFVIFRKHACWEESTVDRKRREIGSTAVLTYDSIEESWKVVGLYTGSCCGVCVCVNVLKVNKD